MKRFVSLLGLLVFILTACGPGRATQTAISPTTASVKTPNFTADSGALVLKAFIAENHQPLGKQTFYAAPLLPVEGTTGQGLVGYVASLNVETAPRDYSDDDGTIVISNLSPGKYSLTMYLAPQGPILLKTSPDQTELTFEIKAGQVTDLGKVEVLVEAAKVKP